MSELLMPQTSVEGVPKPALMHIASMLSQGRQIYGVAGASLTWGIDGSGGGEIDAGIEGERMTARILKDWIAKHPGAVLVHSIQRPTSVGDTDHILIVGSKVILIDSKRWKGKRKYSVTDKGAIKRGTVDFPEGNINIIPALKDWRAALGDVAKVSGIVTIAQDEVFVPYDKNWAKAPFKLVTGENLTTFLDDIIAKIPPAQRQKMHVDIAAKIITRSIKPRNKMKELINLKP